MVCEFCKSATVLDPESATELLEIHSQMLEEEQIEQQQQQTVQTINDRQVEHGIMRQPQQISDNRR